jgi:predicted HicB family RNase H-like nuclease
MGHPHGYDEGKTERVMGQTIEYKGYDGSVLYSAEDRLLHGRILGIRDMVLYDGSSIREIEKNFRGAVDEYLAFCEAEGKTPDLPFKGSFNVRIPQDLHQRAALYAEEHDLKLNAVVQLALKDYLTHAE